MMKISITIQNGCINFNSFNKNMNDEDLNNTNVISTKNIKFTEDYIINNLDLVSAFLNLIVVKTEVKRAKIKDLEICETILKLLKSLPNIEEIVLSFDKELTYSISSLLLENINLKKIDCYSLPEIMFYRFPMDVINTRCEYLFLSDFMKENNVSTYSSLCNKDKVIINSEISSFEFDDVKFFLEKNKNLKRIYINNYSQNTLIHILELLKENNHKGINLVVCESSNVTKEILDDVKLFEKFSKKYNVKIRIKYSKEYKEKNNIKEVNIKLFRVILIIIILLLFAIIIINNYKDSTDNKNTKENIDMINDIVENVQVEEKENYEEELESPIIDNNVSSGSNNYVSPYSQKYNKIYNELLNINSDTVGWLTVNNTNINYPVVQTNDNEYYLKHAYDKTKNQAGWVFVDYRNNLDNLNQNIIIYGHNVIKNDVMFGSLKYTLNPEWYNNPDNLKLIFNIKEEAYTWEVFSIYVIDATTDYLYTDFDSGKEFIKFIDMLKSRSIYDFNVNFDENDKIITLSTCHETNNRRLVLHAKLIK